MSKTLSAWMNRFKAKKPDPAAISSIKAWVLEYLDQAEDVALTVNEIDCNDPGCPGIETIILIMPANKKTVAYKIQKPIEDITQEDVITALTNSPA